MTLRRTPVPHGTRIEYIQDEQAVSKVTILDIPMRIGDIVLRCGGIAGVHTLRAYRQRGYGRSVQEDGIAYMREQGHHMATVFGISNYYNKFGLASAIMEGEMIVTTINAEAAVPRYEVRDFAPADARAVAEIYEAAWGQRTASVKRDPATWGGFVKANNWTDRVGAYVVVDGDAVIGYASYTLNAWSSGIGEVGARDRSAYSTILAQAAKIALARRREALSFVIPPDDPFVGYCRRYGCEIKSIYSRHGNGMARIIDQTSLLQTVQPLLTRRLRASPARDWAGTLALHTDLGEDYLSFDGGRTLRVEMPQWTLMQLLLGYRPVNDALFETEAHIDAEAMPVLEAIFPPGYPFVCPNDRF